jgi:carboxylesterase
MNTQPITPPPPALKIDPFRGEEHHEFTLNGDKGAAILVHGFPGTPDEMRPLAVSLNKAGWTAHSVLLPGFGPDFETLPHRKHHDWARAVDEAVSHFSKQHQPLVVVGNSVGAALALHVSTTTKAKISALALLAPFWKIDHFALGVAWNALPLLERLFPTVKPFKLVKPDFKRQEMRDGMRNFLPDADLDDPQVRAAIQELVLPIGMFNQVKGAGERGYHAVPRVKLPTLIVQGTRDTLVKPATTRRFMQRFKAPLSYIEVNGEHDLVKSNVPAWAAVERAVLEFVQTFNK